MGTDHREMERTLIDDGHIAVARTFFELPESSAYGVGGGMAAIAYSAITRSTEDIDLFRDRRRAGVEPLRAAEALALACERQGWDVAWVRRFPDYARLLVSSSRSSIFVDVALDVFDLPFQATRLGPTIAEKDVAVGEVVALFDRAEARDFADVFAFARRFDREDLLRLARARDDGLQEHDLAERLRRVTEVLGPLQFPESERARFDEIRAFYVDCREQLTR